MITNYQSTTTNPFKRRSPVVSNGYRSNPPFEKMFDIDKVHDILRRIVYNALDCLYHVSFQSDSPLKLQIVEKLVLGYACAPYARQAPSDPSPPAAPARS